MKKSLPKVSYGKEGRSMNSHGLWFIGFCARWDAEPKRKERSNLLSGEGG